MCLVDNRIEGNLNMACLKVFLYLSTNYWESGCSTLKNKQLYPSQILVVANTLISHSICLTDDEYKKQKLKKITFTFKQKGNQQYNIKNHPTI